MMHAIVMAAALSLFGDVNRERAAHGLRPLVLDSQLSGVAEEHASDMAQRRYFSHTSRTGSSPFDRMRAAGVSFTYAGENIAMAPNEVVADAALFKSLPHRANTLSESYTRVGIAVVRDEQGNLLFVEDFSD